MDENAVVYHFTKKENVEAILNKGLLPGTKYNTLGSKLRFGANYFWLSPAHDLMNYKNNIDYECLQVTVNEKLCIVGNMDLISSAAVNFFMSKKGNSLYEYQVLAKLFDETSVNYRSYEEGLFRAPEVIVQKEISPKNINIIKSSEVKEKYAHNRKIYNERIRNKLVILSDNRFSNISSTISYLEEHSKIKKVATHDDSFGLLDSYIIMDTNEFFTIEQRCT